MKVGLGVIKYKRPEHIKLFREQVEKNVIDKYNYILYEYDDETDRRGIAYSKNMCLKNLKHCDYIFLFDDDTFPIKEGFVEFFIKAHKESGQHHFLYLRDTPSIRCTGVKKGIQIFDNCGGAFMFLTKEVIKTVGGFNKDYGTYGMEHSGYSKRIFMSGLNNMGEYLCPLGANKYLYAMDFDYDQKDKFQKKVNHAPSMKDEITRIPFYIEQNQKIYEKDIKTIYQPL